MSQFPRWFVVVALGGWLPVGSAEGADVEPSAAARGALLAWPTIESATRAHFRQQADFQDNDLLWRGKVRPLFAALEKLGWKVPDQEGLLAKLPADDDFLVRSLSSGAGRKFMRRISAYPGSYDRLEQLARMQRGQRRVQDLIHTTRGDEVLEFFAEGQGREQITRRLATAPGGASFGKPTGKIYTLTALLTELKRRHQATADR